MENIYVQQKCIEVIYRHKKLMMNLQKLHKKMADDFITWIPNNIKTSIIKVAPNNTQMSGTFVANTTAIKGVFQRISAQFAKMYQRKAFLHWYKNEGMDEMEFQEADKNV
eukprot:1001373_1